MIDREIEQPAYTLYERRDIIFSPPPKKGRGEKISNLPFNLLVSIFEEPSKNDSRGATVNL